MPMQREIQDFVEAINADQAAYPPGPNYFEWQDRLLIIKVSRNSNEFWGVKQRYVQKLNEKGLNYGLVLLGSSSSGWFFQKTEVQAWVEAGKWKVGENGDYKIHGSLPANNRFTSPQDFCRKVSPCQSVNVQLTVDSEVLEWFRAQGDSWSERMNAALRLYVEVHKAANDKAEA
jgi:hypothetical protein